jgi:fructose-bisphosphate aldolase (EC 4.1.2.13)
LYICKIDFRSGSKIKKGDFQILSNKVLLNTRIAFGKLAFERKLTHLRPCRKSYNPDNPIKQGDASCQSLIISNIAICWITPNKTSLHTRSINTTSSETINAALLAFKEANSDGIIQVSTGGGSFASGLGVAESYKGAIALAEFAHAMDGLL